MRRSLTGNHRYRIEEVGFFRPKQVLILQVEEEIYHPTNVGPSVDVQILKVWRDARVEDITKGTRS